MKIGVLKRLCKKDQTHLPVGLQPNSILRRFTGTEEQQHLYGDF
jgi:hypothetical protein